MNDTPDDLLLLEAEHLARDLLLNADETQGAAASLLNGWTPIIQAASAYFARRTRPPAAKCWRSAEGCAATPGTGSAREPPTRV